MALAVTHAAALYREVTTSGKVWTIQNAFGFPAPQEGGERAMPFRSSRNRAEQIIRSVPGYPGFTPVELELDVYLNRWIAGRTRDKLRVG